jgi:hypothetical protein
VTSVVEQVPDSIAAYAGRPWLAWLMVTLCRQQRRQKWLLEVHREALANLEENSGDVPRATGWKYYYHGRGLLLEGPGNELLDVDFYDDEALTIDPYFFARRVCELDTVEAPEERLRRWLSSEELIVAALNELPEGTLAWRDDANVFRLGPSLLDEAGQVSALDFDAERTQAWDTVLGVSSPEVAGRFDTWLEEILPRHEAATGEILASLSRPRQAKLAKCLLDEELGHRSARVARAAGDAGLDVTESMLRLMARLNPKEHHPYVAWEICKYLLNRGQQKEQCLSTLEQFCAERQVTGYKGNPYDYELAVLVSEHDAHRGLPLLRLALRSKTPACVERASALLALVDQPWSRAEILAAALEGTHEVTVQRMLLAGLLRSADAEAQEQARRLMPMSHARAANEVGFTFDEMIEGNLDAVFDDAMDVVRSDLARLTPTKFEAAAEALGPPHEKPGLLGRLFGRA